MKPFKLVWLLVAVFALLHCGQATSALEKMLDGTQLDYEFINERTVVIEPRSAKVRKTSSISSLPATLGDGHPLLLAQAEPGEPASPQAGARAARRRDDRVAFVACPCAAS